MIIILISVGIIIGAAICFIIANKTYNDLFSNIGIMLSVISFFAMFFFVIPAIGTQVKGDIKYQNALHEKEMLEYRINNIDDNIVGNEMLYNDIVEFNNELRSIKKWANNPWTSWFYVEEIADIDYVEIDGK